MTIQPCGPNCIAPDTLPPMPNHISPHHKCPEPELCVDCHTETADPSSECRRCATCELLGAQKPRSVTDFMQSRQAQYTDVVRVIRAVQHLDTWYYECARADGSTVRVHRLWMLPKPVQQAYDDGLFARVHANLASKPDGAFMRYLGVDNDEHSVE